MSEAVGDYVFGLFFFPFKLIVESFKLEEITFDSQAFLFSKAGCQHPKHRTHLKGSKDYLFILEPKWVTQEYTASWPQMPCSSTDTVSWNFYNYRTKEKSQIKALFKIVGGSKAVPTVGFSYWLMTFLALGLLEVCGQLTRLQQFHVIDSHKDFSSHTEVCRRLSRELR